MQVDAQDLPETQPVIDELPELHLSNEQEESSVPTPAPRASVGPAKPKAVRRTARKPAKASANHEHMSQADAWKRYAESSPLIKLLAANGRAEGIKEYNNVCETQQLWPKASIGVDKYQQKLDLLRTYYNQIGDLLKTSPKEEELIEVTRFIPNATASRATAMWERAMKSASRQLTDEVEAIRSAMTLKPARQAPKRRKTDK